VGIGDSHSCSDHLDAGGDSVPTTEVEHLLRLGDAADERTLGARAKEGDPRVVERRRGKFPGQSAAIGIELPGAIGIEIPRE
jgi:hypothetical protein